MGGFCKGWRWKLGMAAAVIALLLTAGWLRSAFVANRSRLATTGQVQPYPLPAEVVRSIRDVAGHSHVLILGETHGTREVPALAAMLLPKLTKLGYHALALEIPFDQQPALNDWATGKTETVPEFFAMPSGDGRGNVQLLSLIWIAVSPPYQWQLVCFDQSRSEFVEQAEEYHRTAKQQAEKTPSRTVTLSEGEIKLWQKRDASMAAQLTQQLQFLAKDSKVVAICGSMHARVANHAQATELKKLWPSFAAVLQRDHSDWKVRSVNIQFHDGGFFNGGKVNALRGRPIDKAEMHLTPDSDWNWELNLPHATPATFLTPPIDTP
jgi:erythromycin esterase-like protein